MFGKLKEARRYDFIADMKLSPPKTSPTSGNHPDMFRAALFYSCLVLLVECLLSAALLLPIWARSETLDSGLITSIAKSVPKQVATTNAPDTDPLHYQTLEGTHFSYRCHVPHVMKTRQAAVEVCEIDPVKLQIINWPETEVIHLVTGSVSITSIDGAAHRYVAGDIFVLPEGFKGVWDQPSPLSKVVVRHPLSWTN
ncbi:cupin domain-containing protein [Variovorax sp. GB1P17]|uniref:cupin domain-containing protein n=1 Tax=Variovorax sp. GB1P17 TaxID=3443740 RepID=UPI003F4642DC